MSSIQLLDKTRKINKLLHNNNSQKVVFNDICKVLTEVMNSNVLVISKKGKILGKNEADHIEVLHQLDVYKRQCGDCAHCGNSACGSRSFFDTTVDDK